MEIGKVACAQATAVKPAFWHHVFAQPLIVAANTALHHYKMSHRPQKFTEPGCRLRTGRWRGSGRPAGLRHAAGAALAQAGARRASGRQRLELVIGQTDPRLAA